MVVGGGEAPTYNAAVFGRSRTLAGPAAQQLGAVSYLNAKPLVYGLDQDAGYSVRYDVPARLPTMLDRGIVDTALVPVIDMIAPDRSWKIISDACIGCDGETLTVRVFSRVEAERITRLCVDGDSHTSIALADVIWRERFGRGLHIEPYRAGDDTAEAILLIGDKVVNHHLIDFDLQIDLGGAWKSLTGLPFVFAVWAAPAALDTAHLARRLGRARDEGVNHARTLAADLGPGLGWPVDLAVRYLTRRLRFTLGPRHREAMQVFFDLVARHRHSGPVRQPVFA